MSDLSNIGFANSSDLLDKLKRDRNVLKNAILKQEELILKDTVMNFFMCGYHIKDWLRNEGHAGVEEYINNNLELRICADLCNGAKHKILNNPRESGDPINSVNQSEITSDSTAYTADSTLKIDSITYRIQLESGQTLEILHFADTVVELWEVFIAE